jgi:hypothetical protein
LLASAIPPKIPLPFGSSAGGSYINYPIPTASQIGITNGAASFTDGFPPNCFVPVASGGAGPFGKDFNGLLKQTTAGLQWSQAIGIWKWDSAWSTTIGGYPNGAIVQSATTPGVLWQSTTDNNTSNPDTGGANWTQSRLGTAAGTYLGTQVFTANGTYTSSAGAGFVRVRMCGGGGSGASVPSTPSGEAASGSGGDGGAYLEGVYATSTLASQAVTVGQGGAQPGNGANNGNNGTASTIGSILTAPGGAGGNTMSAASGNGFTVAGTTPTVSTGGNVINGGTTPGGAAIIFGSGGPSLSGAGGSSPFGGSSARARDGNSVDGFPGVGPGAGGGGANSFNGQTAQNGGAGMNGIVLIDEFTGTLGSYP